MYKSRQKKYIAIFLVNALISFPLFFVVLSFLLCFVFCSFVPYMVETVRNKGLRKCKLGPDTKALFTRHKLTHVRRLKLTRVVFPSYSFLVHICVLERLPSNLALRVCNFECFILFKYKNSPQSINEELSSSINS